jgi:hypothetical protein
MLNNPCTAAVAVVVVVVVLYMNRICMHQKRADVVLSIKDI